MPLASAKAIHISVTSTPSKSKQIMFICNSLEVAPNGEITGFQMRCEQSKLTTVKALQAVGYETISRLQRSVPET